MTVATGLQATVDVAHESGWRRVGPRTDGADLRVELGRPLRLALFLGQARTSAAMGRAAALAACAEVVHTALASSSGSLVERAAALRDARPDAVLAVAGPADREAMGELSEALRLGCGSFERPPVLLGATDQRTLAHMAARVGPIPAEALPSGDGEPAREAIVARIRGLRREAGDVVLRDESIEAVARALARQAERETLLVDVSGASTSLAHAAPDGRLIAVHAHLGVGARADRIVAHGGLERVRRWIPWPIDGPALLERVFNRARWPDALPASALALVLEMALAREAIAQALRDAERAGIAVATLRAASTVVATGELARLPRAAQTVLVLADALGTERVQLLSRDGDDALIAAGALAARGGGEVRVALEPMALLAAHWPKRSGTATVSDATGEMTERVARGAFFLMPTSGAVQLAVAGSGERATAESLALGVVIDARGRPLELPPRDAERLPAIARWHTALAALPLEGGPP